MGFFFQDMAGGGLPWIAGAVAIFLIAAGAALVAFRIMKKTVKMAVRMTIVAIILMCAVVGSFALMWFGAASSTTNQRPGTSQSR